MRTGPSEPLVHSYGVLPARTQRQQQLWGEEGGKSSLAPGALHREKRIQTHYTGVVPLLAGEEKPIALAHEGGGAHRSFYQ